MKNFNLCMEKNVFIEHFTLSCKHNASEAKSSPQSSKARCQYLTLETQGRKVLALLFRVALRWQHSRTCQPCTKYFTGSKSWSEAQVRVVGVSRLLWVGVHDFKRINFYNKTSNTRGAILFTRQRAGQPDLTHSLTRTHACTNVHVSTMMSVF